MIHASICTIGDEILIGQIVDTNSSRIARALGEAGIQTTRMLSIGDRRDDIRCRLGARGGEKGRQNRAKEGQTFHRVFELETCRPVRGGRLKIPGMNYLTVTVPALKSMVIVCPAVTLTRSWSPPAPRYAILPSK